MSTAIAKVTIECRECGAPREIPKACVRSTFRCIKCQKAHSKEKARARYRNLKGIPLDAPVKNKGKGKKKKKKNTQVQDLPVHTSDVDNVAIIDPWGKRSCKPEITQQDLEERSRRSAVLSVLLDKLDDSSTDEDW